MYVELSRNEINSILDSLINHKYNLRNEYKQQGKYFSEEQTNKYNVELEKTDNLITRFKGYDLDYNLETEKNIGSMKDLIEKYDRLNEFLIKEHEHYDYLENTYDDEEFEEIRTLKDASKLEINNIKAEMTSTSRAIINHFKNFVKSEPQNTKKSVLEKLNENKKSIESTQKDVPEKQIESRGAER